MKVALEIPWGANSIPTSVGFNAANKNFPTSSTTLGSFITELSTVAIYIGAFLMFFWAIWGVFDYLRAEGNKEALAKARKKIIWAISGFVILIMAFFVSSYLQAVLNPGIPVLKPLQIR